MGPCLSKCQKAAQDAANEAGAEGDKYKVEGEAGARAAGGEAQSGMAGMAGMAAGMMGGAGGAGAAGGATGMAGLMALAAGGKDGFKPPSTGDAQEFASKAAQIIAAEVRMFSGCKDEQTSADVYDVSSFGLPKDSGPGGAGGACTNSMVLSLHKQPQSTWVELLKNMRQVLAEKKYTQIPQLSSSRAIDLKSQFSLMNAQQNGRTKALYIGINYVGHAQGELKGCHNDVHMMKKFVESQGFNPGNCKVLMDDGTSEKPDAKNIRAAFKWLVSDVKAGDSLFMHYSGHGGSAKDDNGDEADGKDETLIPVDYNTGGGQIRDDEIFSEIVLPLPQGAQLTVVMDCCHSGSIMDLPYNFEAGDSQLQQVANGTISSVPPNAGFSWGKALKVGMKLYEMHKSGAGMMKMAQVAATAM